MKQRSQVPSVLIGPSQYCANGPASHPALAGATKAIATLAVMATTAVMAVARFLRVIMGGFPSVELEGLYKITPSSELV
ncbi:hypothetical protein [Mycobacteroides abscessus]|uniref:hypothetical protein n=1 Tax=Mycobacteroides abscessus TaxID=36809 RepID=UPI002106C725|nr:hypothetical protein [Mycobacteroides abscessus]